MGGFYHYILRKNMFDDLCEPTLSIKLSPSQDGECSQQLFGFVEKEPFRLKCFKCFGRADPHCPQCMGSQSVASTHPLAFLLGQVLDRKLQLSTAGRRVCPIKEEEQEAEGGKGGCVVNLQGRESEQGGTREKSVCSVVQVDLSQCTIPQQQAKTCYNCRTRIENYYSVCKTCISQGTPYWLCDACSDSQCFTHPADHQLEPVIDYDQLKDKIETISQEYDEESNEEDFPDEPVTGLEKKNSSIANYLEEDYNFMANSHNARDPSRVKFDVEGLFSSYDFKTIQKLNKGQCDRKSNCSSKSKGKSKTINKQNKVQLKPPPQNPLSTQNYIFVDYKCDFCDMQPILNVRYHCRICSDYDLCQRCYEDCDSIHEHHFFERIDGRLIREKAVEKLFQMRDTNLRATNAGDNCAPKSTFYPRRRANSKTLHLSAGGAK